MPPPHDFTSHDEYLTAWALRRQILSNPKHSNFALTGLIPADDLDVNTTALYITSQNQNDKGMLARYSLPLSADDINKVYEAGVPSPHGKGNETVYDPTYRQAHELKPPDFALSVDLIEAAKVLNSLPVTLGLGDQRLTARLHKMNIYGTGGFFKPHRDTPRGDKHLGTLTFCLPSAFEGGELVIRQDSNEIKVDWSSQVMDANGLGSIGWCFLYADCEHEVLPVRTGMRITVAYDVFYADVQEVALGDTRANGMLALFAKVFDPRNNFFPDGAKLGFGLRHAYAGKQGWVDLDELENRLKGIDRVLMSVIKQCGLKWRTRAVYPTEEDENKSIHRDPYRRQVPRSERERDALTYYRKEGTPKNEAHDEVVLSPRTWQFYADVLLADETTLLFYQSDVTSYHGELFESGADVQPEVVWIAPPSVYETRNSYVAYGNESFPQTAYSACAFIVELPPISERQIPNDLKRFIGEDAEVKSAGILEGVEGMRVDA